MRRPPILLPVLIALVTLASGGALVPQAAGHATQAGHAHLQVSLGDDTTTTTVEPEEQLTHTFDGALVAEESTSGAVFIRLRLPDQTDLQRFVAGGHESSTDSQVLEEPDGRYAALVWRHDGPEPGSLVGSVQLIAVRDVDPRASFAVRWPGLGDFEELPVRIELPAGHVLTSGRDLVPNAHGPEGRVVWSQFDLDATTLEFSVRPAFSGPDPAFAAPPNPLGGWLILLGIGLVSGLAWAAGKRLDNRRKD